jgi:hypothetical protein
MAKFKAHLYETEHSGFYDNNDVKHIPYFLPSAWTTFTPEQITTATFNMVPKTWTKFTVTDGDWMTKNTIIPLSSRDLYLADLLDNLAPKLHTFVDGEHTSITTNTRGLKYINQYYNAEDFSKEFKCSQGTIDITFNDDKTEVTLGLNPGIHDLSNDTRCQDWNFQTFLDISYLSGGEAKFNYGSADSLIVNNNFNVPNNLFINDVYTNSLNTTNYVNYGMSITNGTITSVFSTSVSATNIDKVSKLNTNYMVYNGEGHHTYGQTANNVYATNIYDDRMNVSAINVGEANKSYQLTVNGDFEVFPNSGVNKTSLSGILSDYKENSHSNCMCRVRAGTFNIAESKWISEGVYDWFYYNQDPNTITIYKDGDPDDGVEKTLDLANFSNQIKHYQKKYGVNKWIFELGNLKNKHELLIPIYLNELQPFIKYEFSFLPVYLGCNGDYNKGELDLNYYLRVKYKFQYLTSLPCNYYFYTIPYSMEQLGTKSIPIAPNLVNGQPNVVANHFVENVNNTFVTFEPLIIWGTNLNVPNTNWWNFNKMCKVLGVNHQRIFATQINTRFYVLNEAVVDENTQATIGYNCYIYFLNGMNY